MNATSPSCGHVGPVGGGRTDKLPSYTGVHVSGRPWVREDSEDGQAKASEALEISESGEWVIQCRGHTQPVQRC